MSSLFLESWWFSKHYCPAWLSWCHPLLVLWPAWVCPWMWVVASLVSWFNAWVSRVLLSTRFLHRSWGSVRQSVYSLRSLILLDTLGSVSYRKFSESIKWCQLRHDVPILVNQLGRKTLRVYIQIVGNFTWQRSLSHHIYIHPLFRQAYSTRWLLSYMSASPFW